jgi:hypothetical protein
VFRPRVAETVAVDVPEIHAWPGSMG